MAMLLRSLLRMYHWILLLLRLRTEETELSQPIAEETKVPPLPTEPSEKSKQKRQKSKLPETLSELLDNLEATFKHWTLPHSSMSWISKWEVRGLRRLGAYVVNADVREFSWNGYHCLVTSPEFHHSLTSLECDISMLNREDHPNEKGISSEKFAGLIVEMEDR